MGSFRNFCILRARADNKNKNIIILILLSRAISLLPTSSNRQVPPFAPIAVFLFGPLIHEWWILERQYLYLAHEFLIPTKYGDLDRIGEMTTQKQIGANRRNSRRSTGPKTRTGKAESKMNAMKHGLLAADLVVRDENPIEFAGVLENLVH